MALKCVICRYTLRKTVYVLRPRSHYAEEVLYYGGAKGPTQTKKENANKKNINKKNTV